MSFSPVKGGGGWAFGEILRSSEMNTLDADHAKAIDGTGGGTYTLAATLFLTGTNFPSVQAQNAGVGAGSSPALVTFVPPGGLAPSLVCQGDLAAGFTGQVVMDSTGLTAHQFVGATEIPSGSTFKMVSTTDYPLLGSRNVVRLQDDFPSQNVTAGKWTFDATMGGWLQADVGAAYGIYIPLNNLIDSSFLAGVVVRIMSAGHGTVPSTMPTIRLFTRGTGTSAASAISSAVTDASVVGVYNASHDLTVTPTSPFAVTEDTVVFVVLTGEASTNSIASALRLIRVTAAFTTTKLTPGG